MLKISLSFVLSIGGSIFASGQGPFNIGTIHPNDSVVIIYDVQINNPLVPISTTQISNQGTVSGSNFSNQVTDDPDSGPANDPTITFLNMFSLPVTLLELKAKLQASTVNVSWTVNHEVNFLRYEVERSGDGRNFVHIGSVNSLNQVAQTGYAFTDLNPFTNVNFYRLKMVDLDGNYKYSAVVQVVMNGREQSMSSFPNPVTQNSLNIRMTNMDRGHYTLLLYGATGQVAYRSVIYHEGGSVVKALPLPRGLAKGYYTMVMFSDKAKLTNMVIIQ